MKKCKHCDRPSAESYSRWGINEPFVKKFKKERDLKTGELVRCPLCESKWFKIIEPRNPNKDTVSLDFIPDESLEILEAWNSRKFSPTPEQLKVLKKIKATPPDIYGNSSEFITFPCKCVLKNGKVIDFCLIKFQKQPPGLATPLEKPPIYIDQVKEILPSEYTLSPKVRYATTRAMEVAMGFCPTAVRLPTGGYWVFSWTNNFFGSKKIKGKDITKVIEMEPSQGAKESETGKILNIKTTIIYGDWDDKLLQYELNEKSC